MASVVDIANLALAHLGDDANVASINPPEGSAQAEHCARFYPVARDALLEMHDWTFATRRATLKALNKDTFNWDYAYAYPSGALRILTVLPAEASPEDDGEEFETDTDTDGTALIRSNLDDASVRYTISVSDTTKFPPLFTSALTWLLASYLAGPVVKGDAGRAEAKRCMMMFQAFLAQARISDANQRKKTPTHTPEWIELRGAANPYLFDGKITR